MADEFPARIENQARRRARRKTETTLWFGLGTMGVVGWSIALPTLLGVALGVWLDHHHPGPHSWTLIGLAGGVLLGCAIAWQWVQRQVDEEDQ
ncbi:MAG: AtpZ/AtpI family protein [Candidatus Eremiobacteraeota bacterium]|nr:AtpZ/AtpI family protein [Candidatus Eremiobacteraeota bacterium]